MHAFNFSFFVVCINFFCSSITVLFRLTLSHPLPSNWIATLTSTWLCSRWEAVFAMLSGFYVLGGISSKPRTHPTLVASFPSLATLIAILMRTEPNRRMVFPVSFCAFCSAMICCNFFVLKGLTADFYRGRHSLWNLFSRIPYRLLVIVLMLWNVSFPSYFLNEHVDNTNGLSSLPRTRVYYVWYRTEDQGEDVKNIKLTPAFGHVLKTAKQRSFQQLSLKKIGECRWNVSFSWRPSLSETLCQDSKILLQLPAGSIIASKPDLWQQLREHKGIQLMPLSFLRDSPQEMQLLNETIAQNPQKMFVVKSKQHRQKGVQLVPAVEIHQQFNQNPDLLFAQEFVNDAALINDRRFSLRVYISVVRGTKGGFLRIYLYRDGKIMYAPRTQSEPGNYSLTERMIAGGWWSNPTSELQIYDNNPRFFSDYMQYLKDRHSDADRLKMAIRKQIIELMKASPQIGRIPKGTEHYQYSELFAIDFVVQNDFDHPLILEVNRSPDLGFKDVKDRIFKQQLARALFCLTGVLTNRDCLVKCSQKDADNNNDTAQYVIRSNKRQCLAYSWFIQIFSLQGSKPV